MAKITYVVLLLVTLFGACHADNNSIYLRNKIEEVYTSQIGVRELTGKNDGKQVETYLKACGIGKGNPWCAAFITWVYKTCGIKACITAWAPAWFPSANVIYSSDGSRNQIPETGDVFGIYFSNLKRIGHVGFIHKWGNTYVDTVEGNTNEAGSREGDGVYRKRRLKKQIYKVSRFI